MVRFCWHKVIYVFKYLDSDVNLITETHPLLNKGKDKPTTKKGRPRLEHRKGK